MRTLPDVKKRKVHFTKCALLMQDLLAAKRDLRLSREIKRLGRCRWLGQLKVGAWAGFVLGFPGTGDSGGVGHKRA